jgi:hypothetical protein
MRRESLGVLDRELDPVDGDPCLVPFPWRERCTVRAHSVDCVASSINEFGVNDFDMAVLNLLFLK